MPTIDQATLDRWRTLAIVDRDGGTVGSIVEFYLDRGTGHPTWALVNTGLFGSRHTFVPLLHATEIRDGLKVPYEKGHIKDAPRIDPSEDELSPEDEATLLAHYGIEDGTAGEPPPADPGLAEPTGAPAEPGTTAAEGRPNGGPEMVAAGPGPVPAADRTAVWPPGPPPPGGITEPPVDLTAEPRPAGVGEPPPARDEAAARDEAVAEAAGPDRTGLRDEELTAERARPEGGATPEGEPSMLERAKRRLEGLVSGAGPADREAADADRHDERPDVDRDRR